MFRYDTNQAACLCYPRQDFLLSPWGGLLVLGFSSSFFRVFRSRLRFIQFDSYGSKSTFHLGLLALFLYGKKFNNLRKEPL